MQNYKARQTALLGMLFALSMALSFLESMLTPFFGLMPAMKLGLSNIVVMYAVLFLNRRSALYLVLLKALFALLPAALQPGFFRCAGARFPWLCSVCFWHCHSPSQATFFRSAGHWRTTAASCWGLQRCFQTKWQSLMRRCC